MTDEERELIRRRLSACVEHEEARKDVNALCDEIIALKAQVEANNIEVAKALLEGFIQAYKP